MNRYGRRINECRYMAILQDISSDHWNRHVQKLFLSLILPSGFTLERPLRLGPRK